MVCHPPPLLKSWIRPCALVVNSVPKHKVPTRVESPFTVVVSENVSCQGMAVLLNPVCILLSKMLYVYKSEVRVAGFET